MMQRWDFGRLTAAVLVLSIAAGYAVAAEQGREALPVKVIHLRGEPAEMGRQHAEQLAAEIKLLFDGYLRPWIAGRPAVQAQAALVGVAFRGFMLPEHQAEVDAMAGQLKLPVADLMLGNCFLDMLPSMGCSTIALPKEASEDGVVRYGRNLDFPAMNIADKHTVVLVFHPKGRYAFAAITWPGLMGVLSGMNEHGLTLANMEVGRLPALPRAMPYMLLYRSVLERCRTVDEAIEFLEKTPRQSANNLMLVDAEGHRAVVEITPGRVTVRRGQDKSALISTNHQRNQDAATPGRCRRYDTLRKEADSQFGRIGVEQIERMLGQVAQGRLTMQSMVFEPANRVVYLAVGERATSNPYQRIELGPLFEKK